MSTHIKIPIIGELEIQSFSYGSGRPGFVARTPDMKEGDFFNLTVNIDGVAPSLVIFKEYGDAQLVVKHLLENTKLFKIINKTDLGFEKVFHAKLLRKRWAS